MSSMRPIMESWRTHLIEDIVPLTEEQIGFAMHAEQQRIDELHLLMGDATLLEECWLDESILLEFGLADVGHIALDALGLIPGLGEIADGANVLFYAMREKFLMAAFSAISMIPTVGDLIGKAGKLATYLGKAGAKGAGNAVAFLGKMLGKHWAKISKGLMGMGKSKKLGKFVQPMMNAIKKFMGTIAKNPASKEAVVGLQKAVGTQATKAANPGKVKKAANFAKKVYAKGAGRRNLELTTGVGDEEEEEQAV